MSPEVSDPLPRTPVCLALVAARYVGYDANTGELWVLGPYTERVADVYPFRQPSIEVYAALTGCRGEYLVELRFVDLDEGSVIFRQLTTAEFDSPTDYREVVFHQTGVLIPRPGGYDLQLLIHGPARPVTLTSGHLVVGRIITWNTQEE